MLLLYPFAGNPDTQRMINTVLHNKWRYRVSSGSEAPHTGFTDAVGDRIILGEEAHLSQMLPTSIGRRVLSGTVQYLVLQSVSGHRPVPSMGPL